MGDNKMNKNRLQETVQEYFLTIQQINRIQEKFLLQELGYMFVDNPIVDFYFKGINKHILMSNSFDTPNYEVMININGYISITDNDGTVWYQVNTESLAQLPYARPLLDFNWDEIDVNSIINSFTTESDLHKLMELLEIGVSILKQRLWLLKNGSLKLVLIEDKKLVQELVSLRAVA